MISGFLLSSGVRSRSLCRYRTCLCACATALLLLVLLVHGWLDRAARCRLEIGSVVLTVSWRFFLSLHFSRFFWVFLGIYFLIGLLSCVFLVHTVWSMCVIGFTMRSEKMCVWTCSWDRQACCDKCHYVFWIIVRDRLTMLFKWVQ